MCNKVDRNCRAFCNTENPSPSPWKVQFQIRKNSQKNILKERSRDKLGFEIWLLDLKLDNSLVLSPWETEKSIEDKNTMTHTVLATMTFTGLKPSYLLQMLLKMQIQGQFWKLLVLRIPKHPQHVKID